MAATVADPRLDLPRKMLSVDGETVRKALADDLRRQIGRAIERALELAHLTKQDASHRMGYGTNQAPLSRWISGVERPQLERLFAIPELRQPLVQALSELAGADVEVNIRLKVAR